MSARKSKSFGGGTVPVGAPPIDLNIYDQTFQVRGAMSGVRLLKIMRALDGAQKENEESTTEAVLKFITDAFLIEDRERGLDFLENAEPPVEFPLLMEIIQWLVEQYVGNPTEPVEQSQPTSTSTGTSSSESASSTELTSAVLTDTSSSPSHPHLSAATP